MAQDLSTVDPDKFSDITQNAYYQKLQKELKERTRINSSRSDKPSEGDAKKTEEAPAIQEIAKSFAIEDKATLKSYSWKKNKDNEVDIQLNKPTPLFQTSVDLKYDGSAIFRLLGKTIDFTSQAFRLRQQYMSSLVQARSHNFFLSRYAEFKVGVYGQLLAMLGSTPAELALLQKKAIADAIKENEALMAETIYTMEITELVSGGGKKTKRVMAKLKTTQTQLMKQMSALGRPDIWSNQRLIEEQIHQCKRIQDEFNEEKTALEYQLNMYNQERMSV
jgi:hypothetical protein